MVFQSSYRFVVDSDWIITTKSMHRISCDHDQMTPYTDRVFVAISPTMLSGSVKRSHVLRPHPRDPQHSNHETIRADPMSAMIIILQAFGGTNEDELTGKLRDRKIRAKQQNDGGKKMWFGQGGSSATIFSPSKFFHLDRSAPGHSANQTHEQVLNKIRDLCLSVSICGCLPQ